MRSLPLSSQNKRLETKEQASGILNAILDGA